MGDGWEMRVPSPLVITESAVRHAFIHSFALATLPRRAFRKMHTTAKLRSDETLQCVHYMHLLRIAATRPYIICLLIAASSPFPATRIAAALSA